MKWLPWAQTGASAEKFHVKLKRLKVEGFCYKDGVVAVEVKWKGPKTGIVLAPLQGRSSRPQRNCTACRAFNNASVIEWENEFERLCSFSINDAWELTFSFLCVCYLLIDLFFFIVRLLLLLLRL